MRHLSFIIASAAGALVAIACASKSTNTAETSVSKEVTPQSDATLSLDTGAVLQVSSGSVSAPITLGLAEVNTEKLAAAVPADAAPAFAFTPHQTTFEKPVTITIPALSDANVVYRLDDESDTTFEEVPNVAFADGHASFQTSHFCIYVAVHSNHNNGTGGATASGGASSIGGTATVGGTASSGGIGPALGGATSATTGGTTNSGIGGALSTGGRSTIATGGTSTGGAVAATGGRSTATGGTSTGGAVAATGGAFATGGATSTGGALATGGATSTGGALATGGAFATGGALGTGGTTSVSTNGSIGTKFCAGDTAPGTPTACFNAGMAACGTSVTACCGDSGCNFALTCTLAGTYSETACISDASSTSKATYSQVRSCLVGAGCSFPAATN